MAIKITWDNDAHTIIRETFEGAWTWDDFYQRLGKDVPAMMKSVAHRVDILADFRASGPLPLGPAITTARGVFNSVPSNWGCMVIVTDNRFISVLVDTFRKVFVTSVGVKIFTTKTDDEAYQIIGKQQSPNAPQH
jgi:hypothetical protein